jgi:preprotein translocase subunit SecD
VAPPAGTLRVGRYFLALGVILGVLYTIAFWPGSRHTPKLGLDLQGGQEVVFQARTPNGKQPSHTEMEEAKRILTARVNGSGVSGADVVIQGNDQIVVSIPGGTEADIAKLGQAAVLSMRGLVAPAVAVNCTSTHSGSVNSGTPTSTPSSGASSAPSTTPSASVSPKDAAARPLTAASPTPTTHATPTSTTPTSTPTASATPSPSATATAPPPACEVNPLAGLSFAVPTTQDEFAKLTAAQQAELATALSKIECDATTTQSDTAPYYVACDDGTRFGGTKVAYLLGPVIVPGREISSASAQAPNFNAGGTAEWSVSVNMKSGAAARWAEYTAAHNISGLGSTASQTNELSCSAATVPCANFVGIVLDGVVISAPVNQSAINGATQITGTNTQAWAENLATQLKYGSLPLSFDPQTSQTVSATLGTAQLKAGLLAGGIGLALVVIYSLLYYRALGLVTVASLVVSGLLTYGCLVVLATQIGFTLSLAGIAGFIVALGITADSFVVFFERIKDEVHEGRSMRVAVPRAWVRARRTILSADTVSFLAAAILYYFAAGDVRGFAFTLGLSTILDLVVVFLFTHPLISLLSRSKSFGSARFSGLDAVRGTPIPDTDEPIITSGPRRAGRAAASGAGVAVLDRPSTDLDEQDDDDLPAAPPDPGTRTTPQPGSAAERAAARRARLREQTDSDGGQS